MANQYSMSELLDQTVERLPFLRRKVVQLRLRNNSKYRSAVLDELCLKCCDNPEVAEILGAVCAGLMSGDITVTTKFNIDPDKLERLFQILIEYLPKLLEILLPLFMQLAWFLLAFSLFGSSAIAQQCDAKTGQCKPLKNAVSNTAEFVGKTFSAVGAAITPNHVPLPTQYGQAYSIPVSEQVQQSCNCQPAQAPVPAQSYTYCQPSAVTTTSVTSAEWSKSWHRVPFQPLRNTGRRWLGK